ncbi:thiopurine S-methyltransferase [Azotobacter beijerinckii]|uniref:Thiopurine S-methyltransferase n=2 Tax=Azotobacter beijerinckii TaxID=170623 RepID=A0A1H9DQJ0_9GAMM|nr:thiopurine S-methyltransferase [Azotobacter beijerinckii]
MPAILPGFASPALHYRPRGGGAGGAESVMSSRDNPLWLQLWRDRRTDFHQKKVNHYLARFWPDLARPQGSRIFVPLCGKSLDMIWLAEQGHHVIGVELSPVAVRAFFRENRLQPSRRQMGDFTLWEHGRIGILCGDYFALDKADLGPIDTVYDRAALTALPEDIRRLYVAHLRRIVPASAGVFLLTIEDAEEGDSLVQALGVDEELATLYSEGFEISLEHVESVFESDPQAPKQPPRRAEYKVYRLSGRAAG